MGAGRDERSAVAGGGGVRHKVVIVDDHADLRELLAVRFGMVDCLEVVGQAANGVEAIRLARRLSPQLMTLDRKMPVMGGVEAIPLLRAAAPNMRIVIFSSDAQDAELIGGHRPDAVVTKGTHLADLVAIMVGLLAETPARVDRPRQSRSDGSGGTSPSRLTPTSPFGGHGVPHASVQADPTVEGLDHHPNGQQARDLVDSRFVDQLPPTF